MSVSPRRRATLSGNMLPSTTARKQMNYVEKLGDIATMEPVTTDLDGWVVVEGTPSMKTYVQHTSADGSMISGYWEATPGTYHATYTEYEFVHIMEGRLTITPDGGTPVVLGPGDAFVVEAGFKGLWKIDETIRKHFCIKV
jgi:uncharacterized cupin superfamily protein